MSLANIRNKSSGPVENGLIDEVRIYNRALSPDALRATEGCSILFLLAPLADKIGKIKRLYNMGR